MQLFPFFILFFFIWTQVFLSAQETKYDFSMSKLENGKEYCDKLTFTKVDKKETFLYCRAVYAYKYDYRKAHHIIDLAHHKFPYSYNIRLQKALALHELGSTSDATKELIGLLQLYPQKAELHNYLGRIQYDNDIAKSLMPLLISIFLDPKSKQADENLIFVKRLLNIKIADDNIYDKSVALDVAGLDDFDFVNYQLIDTYSSLHYNDEQLWITNRINNLCTALEHTPHQKNGFFWHFYGSYFTKLQQKHLIDAFVSKILNSKSFERERDLYKLNVSFGLE